MKMTTNLFHSWSPRPVGVGPRPGAVGEGDRSHPGDHLQHQQQLLRHCDCPQQLQVKQLTVILTWLPHHQTASKNDTRKSSLFHHSLSAINVFSMSSKSEQTWGQLIHKCVQYKLSSIVTPAPSPVHCTGTTGNTGMATNTILTPVHQCQCTYVPMSLYNGGHNNTTVAHQWCNNVSSEIVVP